MTALLYIYSQCALLFGLAAYALSRCLFKWHKNLPLIVAWLLVFCPLIIWPFQYGGIHYLVIIWYILGLFFTAIFSLFGTPFFFLPGERKDTFLAFCTLWPVSFLCALAAMYIFGTLKPKEVFAHGETVMLFAAFSPNLSAFLVWIYYKYVKPFREQQ